MLEVTVNKEKDEADTFQTGDLVEYPNGMLVVIARWNPFPDRPIFCGTVLYNEDNSVYNTGDYSEGWAKKDTLKKFIGSIILKQS